MDTQKTKTQEIEKKLIGTWKNPINEWVWEFDGESKNGISGRLMIADNNRPVGGSRIWYKVILENDEKIFIELPFYGLRHQHQIWLSESTLTIAYFDYQNQKEEHLVLNKA